jgi:hypothetical protein
MWKKNAQDRRLHLIQAMIETRLNTLPIIIESVISQPTYRASEIGRSSNDAAAITEAAQIFCGIEAEGGQLSKRPCVVSVNNDAMRLRTIFDYRNAQPARHIQNL